MAKKGSCGCGGRH